MSNFFFFCKQHTLYDDRKARPVVGLSNTDFISLHILLIYI